MNDQWKILFDYAKQQLRAANLPDDTWVLGGGTALMLNFQHRYSKDIDIFFSDPQYLSFLSPRLDDAVDNKLDDYTEQANYIKLYFSEGEVDFISAKPISSYLPRMLQQLPDVMTEHPVEIVAKKIVHRTENFKPRDAFDLATVYNHYQQEMENCCALFTSIIDKLQDRIHLLYESGRLEVEMNAINIAKKEVQTARQIFTTCRSFLDTVVQVKKLKFITVI
jgi:predicted nucleotidyltransferase component of viral defense system